MPVPLERIYDTPAPTFGELPVSRIDADAIDQWVGRAQAGDPDRGRAPLSPTSINKLLDTLAAVLELARDYGWGGLQSKPNVVTARRRPENSAQMQHRRERSGLWLDFDQLQVLLRAADELESQPTRRSIGRRPLLMTLFLAGLRVSELCALTWADINLPLGVLHVREAKTAAGSERAVPLPQALIDELAGWKERTAHLTRSNSFVFPTDSGERKREAGEVRPRTKDNVRQRVLGPVFEHAKTIAEAEDVPWPPSIGTHAGRRSYATYLVAAGVDVGRIQDFVGHADVRTTMGVYRQRQFLREDRRYRALMRGPQPALASISD